jgi:hypothetical protein
VRTQALLLAAGIGATAYGAWLLLQRGFADLVATLVWLGGGVVAHDAVLAPVTVLGGVLLTRLLPSRWRGATARLVVIVGSVTLLAVPVLGRFGARADNPTLLDRDYWTGWVLLVAVVGLGVLAGTLLSQRLHRRVDPEPTTRRDDVP